MRQASDELAPNRASFGVGADDTEPSGPWALAVLGAIAVVAAWGLIDRLSKRFRSRQRQRAVASDIRRLLRKSGKTPLPEGSGARGTSRWFTRA